MRTKTLDNLDDEKYRAPQTVEDADLVILVQVLLLGFLSAYMFYHSAVLSDLVLAFESTCYAILGFTMYKFRNRMVMYVIWILAFVYTVAIFRVFEAFFVRGEWLLPQLDLLEYALLLLIAYNTWRAIRIYETVK